MNAVVILASYSFRIDATVYAETPEMDYAKSNLRSWLIPLHNFVVLKDLLGQDMFLIGPPGPLKRHLALMYCVSECALYSISYIYIRVNVETKVKN